MTIALLKKLRVTVICGASSNGRWRSARSLTSTSSVMSSWRSGRGLQWQPVRLWWTQCPRGLRQCRKIMVATQNNDTLGPIWTFSLRGVLTFVVSGLDINGCVLSYIGCTHFCEILYDTISCFAFSLECYKLIVHRQDPWSCKDLVKSSLLYCQFFHMYSTYIQRIEIALLSDPWCIQLTLNTDSRHSNTDKYSLTICTYKLYRYTNEDIVEKIK